MNIKRNTLYNVAGATVPLLVILLTVPLYLEIIGQVRFGLLSIVWLLLGYLGMLDLGLSTASTHAIARARREEPQVRARIFLTSLLANGSIGLLLAAVVLLLGPSLISNAVLSAEIQSELRMALPWLCVAIPITMVGGVLNGLLIAREEFGSLNLVNLAGSVLFQLAPLGAAFAVGPELSSILPAAIVARAVPVVTLLVLSMSKIEYRFARFDFPVLNRLIRYGGWVMVTSLVGPILVSADQVMIGALLGAAAVAPYSVANSFAVRLAVLPSALTQTLFPRLAGVTEAEATDLTASSFRTLSLILAMACVPAILLVRPFFDLWLGTQFAASSAPIAQLLLVAVWVNSLAGLPFTLVRARGRPEIAARFHLLELLPFIVALYFLIEWIGILGGAIAWLLRVSIDTVLLFRASSIPSSALSQLPLSATVVGLAALLAATIQMNLPEAILAALGAFVALAALARQLDPVIRSMFDSLLSLVRPRSI